MSVKELCDVPSGSEKCPSKQFDSRAMQHRMVEMRRVKDVKRDGGKTIKFDTLTDIAECLVEEHEAILCYVPRKREGQEVEPGYVVHKLSGPLPKPSEGLEAQIQRFHNAHFDSYASQLSSHQGSRSLGSGFFDFITSNAPNAAGRQPSRVTFKFPPSTDGDTPTAPPRPEGAPEDPMTRQSVGLLEYELEDVEPLLSYRPRCNSPCPKEPGSPPAPAIPSPVSLAPSSARGGGNSGSGAALAMEVSEYSGGAGERSGDASDSDSDNSMPPAGWFADVKSDTGTAREGTDSERGGASCARRSASADATDQGYESDNSDDDILPQDSYLFQPNSDTQSQTRHGSSFSCKDRIVLKDSSGTDSDDDMLPASSYMFQPEGGNGRHAS